METERTLDDVPYRRIRRAAKAINQTMAMHVTDHEQRLHAEELAEAAFEPPTAEPYQGEATPDAVLAGIVERMARGQESLGWIADELGIPYPRLYREMALYEARVAAHLKRQTEQILHWLPD